MQSLSASTDSVNLSATPSLQFQRYRLKLVPAPGARDDLSQVDSPSLIAQQLSPPLVASSGPRAGHPRGSPSAARVYRAILARCFKFAILAQRHRHHPCLTTKE